MGAAVNSSGKGRSIDGVRGASTSATTTTTGSRVTSGVVAPTLELVASIGIAEELKAVAGSGGVSVSVRGTVVRSRTCSGGPANGYITQQTTAMHPTETRVVSW